ncbi:MAG: HAMP domain-containing histidine kinase [Pedosphaera sp.]|nr:HAMP domain-containing histidine kinase [Pedosphaera sp.]
MRSLRIRLTLWFAFSFLAVTGLFMELCYQHLRVELLRKTVQTELNAPADWVVKRSYSEQEIHDIMSSLVRVTLTYALPLLLVLLILGNWLARKSLSPIDFLNSQLQAVGPRNLEQRVHLPEADEQFRDLTHHLNEMLARLQSSFAEMSEYAAKVAHELRTPLTIVRLKLETSEGKIDPDLAEDVQSELQRLTHVIDQALLIAKAEQGRLLWMHDRLDLTELVGDIASDFRMLAEDEGRDFQFNAEPGCITESDRKHCTQILHSLFTNAQVHGQGHVRIRLVQRRGRVWLTVLNAVKVGAKGAGGHHLGLGLRVVQALVGSQLGIEFRQHHTPRWHASSLSFPATAEIRPTPAPVPASAEPRRQELRSFPSPG